ncbi:hypothetical protein GCM10023214_31660 [Amycolatopsis dongchuanensis]
MQLARLPSAMAPLAFTLLATALTGRLLDRIGPARGLTLLLASAGVTLTALVVVSRSGSPALLTLVVLPGLVAGGLSGGFRTLLGRAGGAAARRIRRRRHGRRAGPRLGRVARRGRGGRRVHRALGVVSAASACAMLGFTHQ